MYRVLGRRWRDSTLVCEPGLGSQGIEAVGGGRHGLLEVGGGALAIAWRGQVYLRQPEVGLSALLRAGESVEHLLPGCSGRRRVASLVGDQTADEGSPGGAEGLGRGLPELSIGYGRLQTPMQLGKQRGGSGGIIW